MATVRVAWENNVPADGAPIASILVTVWQNVNTQVLASVSVPPNSITADVLDVPTEAEGDPLYVASVQAMDAAGNTIGSSADTAPFSVLNPAPQDMLPGNATATVLP